MSLYMCVAEIMFSFLINCGRRDKRWAYFNIEHIQVTKPPEKKQDTHTNMYQPKDLNVTKLLNNRL